MADRKTTSREEDFRDYEANNTRDGWPYADDDHARRVAKNGAYGSSGADLDLPDDAGVAITRDPTARQVDGAPLPMGDGTSDVIADEDLEARSMEALEAEARIDLETIDLSVRNGVVALEGTVDSEDDRRFLIGFLRQLEGVRDVRAEALVAIGVDSHIPRDAED